MLVLYIASKVNNYMKNLKQTTLIALILVNLVVVVVCADTYWFAP